MFQTLNLWRFKGSKVWIWSVRIMVQGPEKHRSTLFDTGRIFTWSKNNQKWSPRSGAWEAPVNSFWPEMVMSEMRSSNVDWADPGAWEASVNSFWPETVIEGTYEKVIQLLVHIVEQTAVRTGPYPRTNCTNLYKQLYKQGQILVETVQTLNIVLGLQNSDSPYIPRFVQFVRGNAQFVQLFVWVCTVCTMICYLARVALP